MGWRTLNTYDAYGNLDCIENTLGETSRLDYDILGRATHFTDGTGHTTRFSYDALDHLIQVTDPLNEKTHYDYDAAGHLTQIADATGQPVTFTYDSQFNLTGVTDSTGAQTVYDYDAHDGLIRVTDANHHVTNYQRDPVGRVLTATDPLSRSVRFGYDAADRLIAIGRADGSQINYQYDALGRLTGVDYPAGPDLTYHYDAACHLTDASYGDDWRATYTYNAAGQLSQVQDHRRGLTMDYTYDSAGRRLRLRVTLLADIRHQRNTNVPYDLAYSYDAAGRLSALIDQTESPATAIHFDYDAAGRRVRITDPGGARADYAYDAAGRLQSVTHRDAWDTHVATYDYVHDARGNTTRITETTPVGSFVTRYTYDALNRLTAEIYPRYTISATYDPVGNLIRQTDPLGTLALVYDAANQLQSRGAERFGYDLNGNVTYWQSASGTYTYTYDYGNLLTEQNLPDGTALTFSYDAFGRRLTAQGIMLHPTLTQCFLYDGLDVLLTGDTSLSQTTARYLYGDHLLVGRQTDSLGFTAYHRDGLENVRYLLNEQGQPFDAYRTDAFGHPAYPTGLDLTPFRFIGQRGVYQHDRPDWPTPLMGLRYYAPNRGDFLTCDLLPSDLRHPFSLNSYDYASGNSLCYNDPSGLRDRQRQNPDTTPGQRPAVAALPSGTSSDQVIYPLFTDLQSAKSTFSTPMHRVANHLQATGLAARYTYLGRLVNQTVYHAFQTAQSMLSALPGENQVALSVHLHQTTDERFDQALKWLENLRAIELSSDSSMTPSPQSDATRWLPVASHGANSALTCTTDDHLLAGAFHAGLFHSQDEGHATWSQVYTASVGELLTVDTNTYYAGTWQGGALKSSDGGASWAPVNGGLQANDVYALAVAPPRLFAGTEMGLFLSDDGGAHWERPAGTLPGRLVSELAVANDVLLAVTDLGLYRSEDSGASWRQPTDDLTPAQINVLLTGQTAGTVYAGTAWGLYRSTDCGDTWNTWGTDLAGQDVHVLAVDPANSNHIVAGTTAGLFVSDDGGDTWRADTRAGLNGIATHVGALAFCPAATTTCIWAPAKGFMHCVSLCCWKRFTCPSSCASAEPARSMIVDNTHPLACSRRDRLQAIATFNHRRVVGRYISSS